MSDAAVALRAVSFDLWLVGVADPAPGARARVALAVDRLRRADAGAEAAPRASDWSRGPAVCGLARAAAENALRVLEEAGGRVEVRPVPGRPPRPTPNLLEARTCTGCGATCLPGEVDCLGCGCALAAAERARERRAAARERQTAHDAARVRRCADEALRAEATASSHRVTRATLDLFAEHLLPRERAFLELPTREGPVVLTSQRLLARRLGRVLSLPWELVDDAAVHRGRPWPAPARHGLRLTLAAPVEVDGEVRTIISWEVDEAARRHQHVLLKWALSHRFACVWCGEEAVDGRREADAVHVRCRSCAADHRVDLVSGRLELLV